MTKDELKEYHKVWYAKNRERILAQKAANPEKRREYERNRSDKAKAAQKEYFKRYYQEHAEEIKAHARAYELADPERRRKASLKWSRANPDKRKKATQTYRENNRDKVRAAQTAWDRANPARRAAYTGKRRSAILQRTPLWADFEAIMDVYEHRPDGYHVDHDCPLQSKIVSGLHTTANLQYLPAIENFRKNNRMPVVPRLHLATNGCSISLKLNPEILKALSPHGRADLLVKLITSVTISHNREPLKVETFAVEKATAPNQGDDGHAVHYADSVMAPFLKDAAD